MAHLRLIQSSGAVAPSDAKPCHLRSKDTKLATEARILESWRGKNLYSDFLLKHERRPDRQQAKIMAQLMNARLRDNEGKLQPETSKSDRVQSKSWKTLKKTKVQSWSALSVLAELVRRCDLAPSDLLDHSASYSNHETIRAQVRTAIDWLARIDSELQARESKKAIGAT